MTDVITDWTIVPEDEVPNWRWLFGRYKCSYVFMGSAGTDGNMENNYWARWVGPEGAVPSMVYSESQLADMEKWCERA